MKIYVSHSREFDFEKHLYAPLRTITNHDFYFPHGGNSPGGNTKEVIKTCDLVLAEVSFPSIGQGIELGWADAFDIPILAIHRRDAKVSKSLQFITTSIIPYDGMIPVNQDMLQ